MKNGKYGRQKRGQLHLKAVLFLSGNVLCFFPEPLIQIFINGFGDVFNSRGAIAAPGGKYTDHIIGFFSKHNGDVVFRGGRFPGFIGNMDARGNPGRDFGASLLCQEKVQHFL